MNLKKQKLYFTTCQIPETVSVKQSSEFLIFSGPLGKTSLNLKKIDPTGLAAISFIPQDKVLKITTSSKSFYGLLKSLINNKIQGISRGFLVYLKIIGIGYRVSLNNSTLFFKLGYSHDIIYKLPDSIKAFLIDPTTFCLFGIDKNQVTQIAAKIRHLRAPSIYKGKGIRLINEKLLLKAGKRK